MGQSIPVQAFQNHLGTFRERKTFAYKQLKQNISTEHTTEALCSTENYILNTEMIYNLDM